MNLLDSVNNILPYLGENPVTGLDTRHPTVALIIDNIDQQIDLLLGRGWWFNERVVTLYPSSEGDMPSPKNTVAIYSLDGRNVEMRNDKLYDLDVGSYYFTEAVNLKLIERLTFNELPEYAKQVVQARAAMAVYIKEFGVESAVEEIQKQETTALNLLMQEHLRKRQFNSLKNNRAARFMSALRS